MTRWRPQHFVAAANAASVDGQVIANALAVGMQVVNRHASLVPIFSLRHLAFLANVEYGLLRAIVSRADGEFYRVFRIRKRPITTHGQRYRVIAVPCSGLMRVQRWIHYQLLRYIEPSEASVAFADGNTLLDAVAPHRKCKWLIKLDVKNFFESVNEISVYRVFLSLGYQPLVAFEMTRICTRLGSRTRANSTSRWQPHSFRKVIQGYEHSRMGHLPQGAPTSPMLANLAMREFDREAIDIAANHGFVYTRYADDLAFSTNAECDRATCQALIGQMSALLVKYGLSPNHAKAKVSPPGARKILLGLLIDTDRAKLTREFKAAMRCHLYFINHPAVGVVAHVRKRGFASVMGFRHYLNGLVGYAMQIEPNYGMKCKQLVESASWPI